MKFIPSHVSFICKSNSGNCIQISGFLTKLPTNNWLLFYGPRCSGLLTKYRQFNGIMPQVFISHATGNHATGYASQHIWCLFQAMIKWKGCSRKGIRRKIGGKMEIGGPLISSDAATPSKMVSVSATVSLPLHHKLQEKISSSTGSSDPGVS